MAMLSFQEIINLLILTAALGYIFSGFIRRPKSIDDYFKSSPEWEDMKYAAIIVAPAVIFHELAHKAVGLYFGFDAILGISVFGLGLGVILRFIRSPIIFFIPAFVISTAAVNFPEKFAVLALAGPAANFALYWLSDWALLSRKWPKHNNAFIISRRINLWLLILNMIPVGFFDGAKVLKGDPMLYLGAVFIGGFLIYRNEKKWKNYSQRF
jgi:Zn-dependent protease|tara:strand:+ start:3685 stop:4317 length:633 start_codon:yes stop_codon:yes gene_type:complete